jgi:putative transposase
LIDGLSSITQFQIRLSFIPKLARNHLAMTKARSRLIDPNFTASYHCIHHCVRRAYLCGYDPYLNRSVEHRKIWIQERLNTLSDIFACDIYGHAVMNHHLHIVVHMNPPMAREWSDLEVATRWVHLYPAEKMETHQAKSQAARSAVDRQESQAARSAVDKHESDIWPRQKKINTILSDPERIRTYRARLANLSWLIKSISEPFARLANAEDDTRGKFWEGRFKSRVLADAQALSMTLVDLNSEQAKNVARNTALLMHLKP